MRYEQPADPAQGQLAQLRADLDVRLAALEAALADPAHSGASLAGLILDLARVATEEAKAAAASAYLDAKREGDARVAQARADGQAALDPERAASAELRRKAESAAQRIEGLEDKEAELASAVAQLESALARVSEDAGRFERDFGDARLSLDAERESNAALRQAAEHAAAASESQAHEHDNVRAAHTELQASHKELQAAHKELRGAHKELQAHLDAERASALELRQVAARAADMSETLVREKTEIQAAHESVTSELARERAATAELYRELADAQAQLESERASTADLRGAAERAQAQLEAERASTHELRAIVERAQAQQASASTAQAHSQATHESLQRELAAARAEASFAQAELDEARTRHQALESQLDESRARALESQGGASTELRQAADSAQQKIAKLIDLQNETVAKTAAARRDLVAAQGEASSAKAELEKMKARVQKLESERTSTAELSEAVERAEQRLASVTGVQVQTLTNYEKLEKELALAQQEAAVLRSKLGRLEKAGAARSKLASASEQEWEAIRLAARCVLTEPITIEVDGAVGLLVDLSVDGCQLLLREAVKQKQVVKLVLPAEGAALACTGKVAWVRPEPTQAGEPALHRAGVAFIKPDLPALEAFIAAHVA